MQSRNIKIFNDTLQQLNTDKFLKESVQRSVKATEIILEDDKLADTQDRFTTPASISISKLSTCTAARLTHCYKTAILNFASATRPGGGVLTGSKAQEECICRQSTLYPSLITDKAQKLFYERHKSQHNALNNNDIIYTPNVIIFKTDDYSTLQPFAQAKVDVITCAAPNLSTVKLSSDKLLKLHESRAERILSVAKSHEIDYLILGAFGCGVFMNDPVIVAEAYKNVINSKFLYAFKSIEFAIYTLTVPEMSHVQSTKNYDAFVKVFFNRE